AAKRPQANPEELRRQKENVFEDLRRQYAKLKVQWGGYLGYDDWFAHDLNNAKLNTVANYYDYLPGFQRLLASNGADLEKFYAEAARLSKQPIEQRHAKLRELATTVGAVTVRAYSLTNCMPASFQRGSQCSRASSI